MTNQQIEKLKERAEELISSAFNKKRQSFIKKAKAKAKDNWFELLVNEDQRFMFRIELICENNYSEVPADSKLKSDCLSELSSCYNFV